MKYSLRSLVTFSIRDLMLATTIVALAAAWWVDRSKLAKKIESATATPGFQDATSAGDCRIDSAPDSRVAKVAVTGRVTYFGRPVAGASVMLTGTNSLFDGQSEFDGRFQLQDQTDSPNSVPPGQYTLCVSVPGNDANAVPPFVWDRWAKTPWHKTHISPNLAQKLDIQLESP